MKIIQYQKRNNPCILSDSDASPLFIPDMRTQIATVAMQGLLNATSVERFTLRIKPEVIAQAAVEYADALINELNKPKDEVATDK